MLVARKFIREKFVDRGWARRETDRIHVIPKNDRKDHKDGIDCWCIPDVQEGGALVVHNALDGRELFEGDSDIADLFAAAAKAGLNYSKIRYSKTEEGETK